MGWQSPGQRTSIPRPECVEDRPGYPLANVRIEHPVQEHVHLADRPGVQVHLLSIEGEILRILSLSNQMIAGLDEHTP